MKQFFASVLIIVGTGVAASAEDMIIKSVPLTADRSVVWHGATCPAGYVCLDEADGQATLDNAWQGGGKAPDFVLPEWSVSGAQAAVAAGQLSDDDLGAYLKGMSDKGIVDICALCGCCIITQDPDGAVPFDTDLLGLE